MPPPESYRGLLALVMFGYNHGGGENGEPGRIVRLSGSCARGPGVWTKDSAPRWAAPPMSLRHILSWS